MLFDEIPRISLKFIMNELREKKVHKRKLFRNQILSIVNLSSEKFILKSHFSSFFDFTSSPFHTQLPEQQINQYSKKKGMVTAARIVLKKKSLILQHSF